MSDASAEFNREPEFVSARMVRRFDDAPAAVWEVMTEPARLATWLARGRIEPALGGAVRLDFEGSGTVIDCRVSAFVPGRTLAFSWSQPGEPLRPVRWDLEPDGAGTRLTLTIKTPHGEDPGKACAGWDAHMAMLAAALSGAPIGFPFEVFKAAREAYKPRVAALQDEIGFRTPTR
jgi:uncharacterized protein YndB with AHSA1/START domain